MKITTEELERCEVLLTIEMEPAQEQDLLKKAAKRISKEVRIPGFRPGKAPYNVIVRRFGLEALQTEVLESSVEKLLKDALAEVDFTPYAQVQLDNVSWDPLMVKVRVPVEPKIVLGDYREVRLEAEPVEVTDEDVDQALKALQEQQATWTPVERPAEMGDLISMSVAEKMGEEVLAQQESADYELVAPAEEAKRPDLTTPLLGLSAGESRTFTVTYPEEYENEQYAGKEVTFTVEASSIKAKELEPLDDDFAQLVGEFENLAELKDKIKADIRRQRESERDFELGYKALDKIVEEAEKIEWPLALEDETIEHELEDQDQRLKRAGLTLDGYLQVQKKTREDYAEELRSEVQNRLRRSLALGKIAGLEKLEVSHSEILGQAKRIADYAQGGEQVWRNILASEAQQRMIANDLLSSKVVFRLATIARGEAPSLDGDQEGEGKAGEEPEAGVEAPAAVRVVEAASEAQEMVEPGTEGEDAAVSAATSDEATGTTEEKNQGEDRTTEESVTTNA